jgi:hypothetical protein
VLCPEAVTYSNPFCNPAAVLVGATGSEIYEWRHAISVPQFSAPNVLEERQLATSTRGPKRVSPVSPRRPPLDELGAESSIFSV